MSTDTVRRTIDPNKTVAVPREVASQVVTFGPVKRTFVLINGRERPREFLYGGTLITVPAVTEVGPHTAYDADGDAIPGTREITDIFTFKPETGEDALTLDAAKCIAHILGITRVATKDGEPVQAICTSPDAGAGLALLPMRAPKPVWMAVREDALDRAYLARVERARTAISEVDEKNAKRRAAGMDAVSGGWEYDRAVALVNAYNDALRAGASVEVKPTEDDSIDEEIELIAMTRVIALELVEKVSAGKTIDKNALLDELLNDPKVRIAAQKRWRIQKKGHMVQKESTLQAAADAGLTVAGAGLESGLSDLPDAESTNSNVE